MPLGPFVPNFGFAQTTNGATQITQLISGTSATGFQPPTNAVAFFLQTSSLNTDAVRWRVGAAANVSLGHMLEGGRDTGFIPFGGSTLTVCAASATQEIQLTWFTNS